MGSGSVIDQTDVKSCSLPDTTLYNNSSGQCMDTMTWYLQWALVNSRGSVFLVSVFFLSQTFLLLSLAIFPSGLAQLSLLDKMPLVTLYADVAPKTC